MNKSLIRSIGFWLLIILSIASGAVGAWLVNSQLTNMTSTLLAGTATGVEVYVGQSLVVLGSVLIGAGIVGIILALALVALRSLIPTSAPAATQPIDWTAEERTDAPADAPVVDEPVVTAPADVELSESATRS